LIEQNPANDLAGAVVSTKSVHRPALSLERLPELMNRLEAYNEVVIPDSRSKTNKALLHKTYSGAKK